MLDQNLLAERMASGTPQQLSRLSNYLPPNMNAQGAVQQNQNVAATKQHSVPVNHWAAGGSKEN